MKVKVHDIVKSSSDREAVGGRSLEMLSGSPSLETRLLG
jgi:hypothetical protein